MIDVDCVVWDFDGVLNDGLVDGRFVWSDTFEDDIGHPLQSFASCIFNNEFEDVICGRKDLLDHIDEWVTKVGYSGSARHILDYWLKKDARTDPHMLAILKEVEEAGVRSVIATNNEVHRANYIEAQMGFSSLVDRVFSSGRMKCMKPEPAYFGMIVDSLQIHPNRLILIDDSWSNVESARALGWKAHHFERGSHDNLRQRLGLRAKTGVWKPGIVT